MSDGAYNDIDEANCEPNNTLLLSEQKSHTIINGVITGTFS
jgi:hypothetical protein